jgi:alkylation response protein AidB-like acyl-CoA dehydrogenase
MATTTDLPALDPLDYLALDALLDDEERAIRDTVRQFVRDNVLDEVGDWFEQGIFPRELFGELAKLGLLGMHLEGYGLPGASSVAYGLTCMELEAGDAGVRSAVSVQGSLAMFPIWKWGSEEQKERWLPDAPGEVIGASASRSRRRPTRLDADARAATARLDPERREDVDHERTIADIASLGPHRRRERSAASSSRRTCPASPRPRSTRSSRSERR